MSASSTDNLASSQYLTVIVRLVLGGRGRLLRGELADVDGTTRIRFAGWQGLTDAMRSYLAGRELDGGPEHRPS